MTGRRKPSRAKILEAVEKIRREAPVDYLAASKEVNRMIREQDQAIRAQLEAWGLTWCTVNNLGTVVEGRNVWHTGIVTFEDGHQKAIGRWGDNAVEVELHLRLGHIMFRRPGVQLEVVEDADAEIHKRLQKAEKDREKQAAAIFRKAQRTKAKYTDNKTTPSRLEATMQEGMLF